MAWEKQGEDIIALVECDELTWKSLMAAEDCLLALGGTAWEAAMLVATAAAARTAIEASAQAFWLLDPDLPVVERVRRFMRLVNKATQEAQGIAADLRLPAEAEQLATLADIQRRVNRFASAKGGLGATPTKTRLVGEVLETLQVEDRGLKVLYPWYSGLAHADKLALDNLFQGRFFAGGAEARDEALMERTAGSLLWAASFSYTAACDRAVSRYGWSPESWRSAALHWTDCVHDRFAEMRSEAVGEALGE